ncbi:Uncharacterised protein [Mycobacteroides abscessus subsp. abscessus]|nr:Uncharacterised protein [Mycobacteroides abscessus subsp. abscessus]
MNCRSALMSTVFAAISFAVCTHWTSWMSGVSVFTATSKRELSSGAVPFLSAADHGCRLLKSNVAAPTAYLPATVSAVCLSAVSWRSAARSSDRCTRR